MAVSQMAFRARKLFGTFEKQAPGQGTGPSGVLVAQWVEHPNGIKEIVDFQLPFRLDCQATSLSS